MMDPAKLKVVELRAELSSRGLDTKGVKAVLVERLKQALEEETGEEQQNTSVADTSGDETAEEAQLNEIAEEQNVEATEEQSTEPTEEESKELVEEKPDETEAEPEPEPELESEPVLQEETVPEPMEVQVKQEPKDEPVDEGNTCPAEAAEKIKEPKHETVVKQEQLDKEVLDKHVEETEMGKFKKQHYEAEIKQEPEDVQMKEEERSVEESSSNYSNDRKRKHSRSPSPENQERQQFKKVWKDHEPEIDDNIVQLSWYDSDLNLMIDQNNFMIATPMSDQGFGYIWAGVRANYGFSSGKICFEVKVLENNDVSHLQDEPSPHVLRVGWSILSSGMLLGEEPFSYGYGGTGKASTNCNFINYGKPFVVGDVVTAYLDYGPDNIIMSFAVNGEYQGIAYSLPHSTLDGQALFPHLLSKNIKFELNFGQNEPWFQPLPEFVWASQVEPDQRVSGPKRPENRSDCEMLMMCGLPGSGKTVWANDWAAKYPEKFYNILGSNNLIDKMKIQGLPRKRNYHGRWDILIEKCMKCLNKLLDMAHKRRRNYILDQTNVYPSAQKRKMRNFGGFVRRAIVIVPTDEEFRRRVAKRESEEGKDVPDSAVMEMKANFKLPETGEYFDEVIYTELSEEEAKPIVEMYNKEGRDAGYGQQNTFSGTGGRGNKRFRPNERPPWSGGNFRGNNRGMDRGAMDRGRGGWQPRGDRGAPQAAWRDRKPGGYRAGGRDGHDRDQGWRGGRDDYRGRDNYGGGRDSYRGGRDNYGGGRDNYGGGRDNYGGGREDRSRSGSFDRNRRDAPPRDNKNRGGGNQGGSGGPSKQGGSGWGGNQGYEQGWGQNQNYGQTWGQNYQQAWKAPESQQQGYDAYGNQTQYGQYGAGYNQYPGQQAWNQATDATYGYGQGVNNYGYGYVPPPNQGK